MFFHVILLLVSIGAAVHVLRGSTRSAERISEVVLLWVLVGYCGIPMLGFMAFGLVHPHEMAELTGFTPGSPFQTFVTWALLGMSIAAIAALRYRGPYLIGPALAWSVFFVGATGIHLRQYSDLGALSHSNLLIIFVTHGLISVVLLAALVASGLLRSSRS